MLSRQPTTIAGAAGGSTIFSRMCARDRRNVRPDVVEPRRRVHDAAHGVDQHRPDAGIDDQIEFGGQREIEQQQGQRQECDRWAWAAAPRARPGSSAGANAEKPSTRPRPMPMTYGDGPADQHRAERVQPVCASISPDSRSRAQATRIAGWRGQIFERDRAAADRGLPDAARPRAIAIVPGRLSQSSRIVAR